MVFITGIPVTVSVEGGETGGVSGKVGDGVESGDSVEHGDKSGGDGVGSGEAAMSMPSSGKNISSSISFMKLSRSGTIASSSRSSGFSGGVSGKLLRFFESNPSRKDRSMSRMDNRILNV